MACYRPLRAFQCSNGAVVFAELGRYDIVKRLDLPCGQCPGCRLERSRQWAMRAMHEAQMWEWNAFVTLTYADENLPNRFLWGMDGEKKLYSGSLRHRDFQLFIKRLRKALGKKGGAGDTALRASTSIARSHGAPPHTPGGVRYYMCGEYGETYERPHYHACLFGIDFADKQLLKTKNGIKLYTSSTLENLWGLGQVTTGELTFESAAYTARYVMKKITGQKATLHYEKTDLETGEIKRIEPEYNKMSLKPGIGAEWLKKFERDVYPKGEVIVRGHPSRSPKYYDRLHRRAKPDESEALAWSREARGIARWEDNTDQRLKARETVTLAKINQLKRTIE